MDSLSSSLEAADRLDLEADSPRLLRVPLGAERILRNAHEPLRFS